MGVILHIETGTDVCSVAISKGDELMALRENTEGWEHARLLAVFIEEVLEEAGLTAKDLDAVAVGKGPGSYTGLRVGVSTAKGLAYGCGIPLIAVDSLRSLACHAIQNAETTFGRNDVLMPMIDARRMEVYVQCFDYRLNPLGGIEAKIITPDAFADQFPGMRLHIFGDGADKCRGVITRENVAYQAVRASAAGMVPLAAAAFRSGDFVDTAYFEPFYLKDFVVIPLKKKIL